MKISKVACRLKLTKNADWNFSKLDIFTSEASIKNRLNRKFSFDPYNITTKFQDGILKTVREDTFFKVD